MTTTKLRTEKLELPSLQLNTSEQPIFFLIPGQAAFLVCSSYPVTVSPLLVWVRWHACYITPSLQSGIKKKTPKHKTKPTEQETISSQTELLRGAQPITTLFLAWISKQQIASPFSSLCFQQCPEPGVSPSTVVMLCPGCGPPRHKHFHGLW